MKREVKIGIFLTIAALIVATFIFIVGDLSTLFQRPGYEIYLYFKSATGLEKRTGVRLAGVKIGYVDDIRLKGNQAEVVLSIQPDVQLRKDSSATLAALGLLGEKYIEIIPGAEGEICPPGGSIATIEPVGLDQLGSELAAVGVEIKETGRLLREMIGSEDSQTNIKLILENLASFAADLKEFSRSNTAALEQGIQNGSRAIGNFDDRVQALAESLDDLVTLMQDVVAENRDSVKLNLEQIRDLLQKADKSLGTLDETLNKINTGEGTLGKLIQEPALYEEAQKTMGDVQRAVRPVSGFRALGSLEFNYFSDPEEIKSYVSLSLWPAADKFLLGQMVQDPLVDDFTFSLQGGMRWGDLAARAGIMESKIGAAMDFFALRDRLRFTLEAYDVNRERSPHFRFYTSYTPVKHVSLLFGLDDFGLRKRRELFFGLGFGI